MARQVTRKRCKSACKTSLVREARVKMQRNLRSKKARPKMIRRLARDGRKENGTTPAEKTGKIVQIKRQFKRPKPYRSFETASQKMAGHIRIKRSWVSIP